MRLNLINPAARQLACAVLCAAAGAAHAQVAVVVNPKSVIASMSAEQVATIFLGKSNQLPNGNAAQAVDLPEGAAQRDHFYTHATGKSAAQVKAVWSRIVFSGKGTPPKEVGTSADVKKFVAANADAIGYIEKSAVDASVKVVLAVD